MNDCFRNFVYLLIHIFTIFRWQLTSNRWCARQMLALPFALPQLPFPPRFPLVRTYWFFMFFHFFRSLNYFQLRFSYKIFSYAFFFLLKIYLWQYGNVCGREMIYETPNWFWRHRKSLFMRCQAFVDTYISNYNC